MSFKTWTQDKINKKHQEHCIRKEQQTYQSMLKGVDYRGTEVIFNSKTLAWLVIIVTVFLQIISLATTYEGSKVYFGGVSLPFGLSAPLLFALAIQLIVFCMSHTIRKQFKIWLVMILCMATLCSAYFSYIGIYNHINSPVDYLEERYAQIYGNITEKYQLVVDQAENNMKEYTFDLVSRLNKSYTLLEKKVQEDKVLSEKINGVKVDTGKINAQTSSLKKPNINNYGENLDKYYEDMAKYNAAVGTMITDTTKQDADLKNQLYDNEVKALLGGKSKEEFINESIETGANKEQLEKVIESMYSLIGTSEAKVGFDEKMAAIEKYCLKFIMEGQGDKDIFSTLLTNLYTAVISLEGNSGLEHFKEELNHFTTLSQKDKVMMKSLDEVRNSTYKEVYGVNISEEERIKEKDAMVLYNQMQSEIKGAAYLLNQMNLLDKPIDLMESEYVMHNLYVLPIKNLIENSASQAMAWFCLAFAVLIDGLTLLFALMEGKEKTPLFAKSNKDIVGRSKEAMEELLLTTIMNSSVRDDKRDVVQNTLLQLEGFLRHFELMSEGIESGYSMWCPLDKLKEYNTFLAVLCQFNLASILEREDIAFLKKGEGLSDEKYVLIKTKFVIWAKEKCADLALRHEYIEEVQALEGKLKEEGDMV